jgi:hypothetical protein
MAGWARTRDPMTDPRLGSTVVLVSGPGERPPPDDRVAGRSRGGLRLGRVPAKPASREDRGGLIGGPARTWFGLPQRPQATIVARARRPPIAWPSFP